MTTATLPRARKHDDDAEAQTPATSTWQPSQWSFPFSAPAGHQIASAMTTPRLEIVLAFSDHSAPAAPARREQAGEMQQARDLAAARDELAPALDPRGFQAARQGLIDLPQEMALAEARLAEVQAKAARLQIDPTAGPTDRAEAQQAAVAAERHVAAVRGKEKQLETDMGQMQGGLFRKVRETCQRVVSESEATLRKEMDSLLRDLAKRMGPDLSRLRDLHDALNAPQRQRAVDTLAEKLLHELQTA